MLSGDCELSGDREQLKTSVLSGDNGDSGEKDLEGDDRDENGERVRSRKDFCCIALGVAGSARMLALNSGMKGLVS